MIDLVLVIGFLGSGKTTLLKRIHKQNIGRKLVFLVNEFSVKDVDAEILKEENDSVISVAGGSIFCTCKATEFIKQLKLIPEKYKDTEKVIIEASGTANPMDIQKMLTETGLGNQFSLERIISVMDPVTLPKLLHTLPNIRMQLECADHILLNKIDLVDDDERSAVEKTIKEINPQARLELAEYCEIQENILDTDSQGIKTGSDTVAHKPQDNFTKFSISTAKQINPKRIEDFIKSWNQDIYRIKGYFKDNNNICKQIDYSQSSGLQFRQTSQERQLHMEFIFTEKNRFELADSIKALAK